MHDIHYMSRYSTEAAYFQTLDVDVPMLHLLHMRYSCMLCFEPADCRLQMLRRCHSSSLMSLMRFWKVLRCFVLRFKNLPSFGAVVVT